MQTTLDRPATTTSHRFDADVYHRMAAAGILGPEDRIELIEGEIVDKAPIGSEHNGVTDFLSSLVARAFADGKVHVRVQGPLRIDRRNEPQPDLMLLRPRADYYRSGHPTADVLLLVEIVDGSLAYNSGPKLAFYARHGVPEVWVVDHIGGVVEICREPGAEGYVERRRVTKGRATPTLMPGLAVDLAVLFG
jgi:Uma2 family endonuclease